MRVRLAWAGPQLWLQVHTGYISHLPFTPPHRVHAYATHTTLLTSIFQHKQSNLDINALNSVQRNKNNLTLL